MEIKNLIGKKIINKKYGEGIIQCACGANALTVHYDNKICNQLFPREYPKYFQFIDNEADEYAIYLKNKTENEIQILMKEESDREKHEKLAKECNTYNLTGISIEMPSLSDKSFIKFEGTTDNPDNIWMVNSIIDDDGQRKFLLNFSNVSERIEEDSEFFICKGYGTNVYIYGRGIVTGYRKENIVKKSWIKQHPWMEDKKTIEDGRMPRNKFVFVKKCEILATDLTNCPTLMSIFKEYGGDILESKKGKEAQLEELSKAHYQKSHVFLSTEGYCALDKSFCEAAKEFGTYSFLTK